MYVFGLSSCFPETRPSLRSFRTKMMPFIGWTCLGPWTIRTCWKVSLTWWNQLLPTGRQPRKHMTRSSRPNKFSSWRWCLFSQKSCRWGRHLVEIVPEVWGPWETNLATFLYPLALHVLGESEASRFPGAALRRDFRVGIQAAGLACNHNSHSRRKIFSESRWISCWWWDVGLHWLYSLRGWQHWPDW